MFRKIFLTNYTHTKQKTFCFGQKFCHFFVLNKFHNKIRPFRACFGQNELLYDICFLLIRKGARKNSSYLYYAVIFLAAMVPILFSWSSLLVPQRNWRGMRSLGPF